MVNSFEKMDKMIMRKKRTDKVHDSSSSEEKKGTHRMVRDIVSD